MRIDATYILPIRHEFADLDGDLGEYLQALAGMLDVVVVDGSPAHVFDEYDRAWGSCCRHVPVDPDLETPNGKVGGVLTGLRYAPHERLVIADDDIRYDRDSLAKVISLLDRYDVVRPQNYFDPLPWHARWDTARSLLNRMTGGDWPGTLGVRRSILMRTGGYDGSVLFENLELVRTVLAAGGRETVSLDLFVRRLPPSSTRFWEQRVRQAYDEWARPLRLATFLAILPALLLALVGRHWFLLLTGVIGVITLAGAGRYRDNGSSVFPASAAALAPLWLLERAVCSWLAVGVRVSRGGVAYRDVTLARAATPMRVLRRRHAGARISTWLDSDPGLEAI